MLGFSSIALAIEEMVFNLQHSKSEKWHNSKKLNFKTKLGYSKSKGTSLM
jgi:hypothetical protein